MHANFYFEWKDQEENGPVTVSVWSHDFATGAFSLQLEARVASNGP